MPYCLDPAVGIEIEFSLSRIQLITKKIKLYGISKILQPGQVRRQDF